MSRFTDEMLDREYAAALALRDRAEEIARVQRDAVAAYFRGKDDLAPEAQEQILAAALANASPDAYRRAGWLRMREIANERRRRAPAQRPQPI